MKTIRPPFKIHGGKYYLSKWIIEHLPPEYEKYDYVESHVGAGSCIRERRNKGKPRQQDKTNLQKKESNDENLFLLRPLTLSLLYALL